MNLNPIMTILNLPLMQLKEPLNGEKIIQKMIAELGLDGPELISLLTDETFQKTLLLVWLRLHDTSNTKMSRIQKDAEDLWSTLGVDELE